jgi:hypothetical protein
MPIFGQNATLRERQATPSRVAAQGHVYVGRLFQKVSQTRVHKLARFLLFLLECRFLILCFLNPD